MSEKLVLALRIAATFFVLFGVCGFAGTELKCVTFLAGVAILTVVDGGIKIHLEAK